MIIQIASRTRLPFIFLMLIAVSNLTINKNLCNLCLPLITVDNPLKDTLDNDVEKGPLTHHSIQEGMKITLISPIAGSYIRSNYLINVSFDPIPINIRWRWDSVSNWTYFTPIDFVNISVPFVSGTHYLEVAAQDDDFKWETKAWAFKIDDNRIFITLENPNEFTTHKSGTSIVITFDPSPASALFAWDSNPY
ncbi:MAG: hypothetical protein ACXAC2_11650 [Candidatus Kariarchaeaceae archaeon]